MSTDPLTFACDLLSRGIELVLRGNRRRLHVWPARAFRFLTDDERAFIKEHRDELKALAEAKVLPETTVTWHPPGEAPTTAEPPPDAALIVPICSYCERPCVGADHAAYRLLHFHDPAEIGRRDREATALMRRMVGRPSRLLEF